MSLRHFFFNPLENPMDGGAWWAAVHGVARSRTRLSNFTFTFHFHALDKEMATHSSVLAWRIPGMGEPCGLPSLGSHRVGHDWSDLAAAAAAVATESCHLSPLSVTWVTQLMWENLGNNMRHFRGCKLNSEMTLDAVQSLSISGFFFVLFYLIYINFQTPLLFEYNWNDQYSLPTEVPIEDVLDLEQRNICNRSSMINLHFSRKHDSIICDIFVVEDIIRSHM